MRLVRLYELTPLVCPVCSADKRIVAFITEGDSVSHVREIIGESTAPQRSSSVWRQSGRSLWNQPRNNHFWQLVATDSP
jgi:hypothetical protein